MIGFEGDAPPPLFNPIDKFDIVTTAGIAMGPDWAGFDLRGQAWPMVSVDRNGQPLRREPTWWEIPKERQLQHAALTSLWSVEFEVRPQLADDSWRSILCLGSVTTLQNASDANENDARLPCVWFAPRSHQLVVDVVHKHPARKQAAQHVILLGNPKFQDDRSPRTVKVVGGAGRALKLCENGDCVVSDTLIEPWMNDLVGQNFSLSLGHPRANAAKAHLRGLSLNGRAISLGDALCGKEVLADRFDDFVTDSASRPRRLGWGPGVYAKTATLTAVVMDGLFINGPMTGLQVNRKAGHTPTDTEARWISCFRQPLPLPYLKSVELVITGSIGSDGGGAAGGELFVHVASASYDGEGDGSCPENICQPPHGCIYDFGVTDHNGNFYSCRSRARPRCDRTHRYRHWWDSGICMPDCPVGDCQPPNGCLSDHGSHGPDACRSAAFPKCVLSRQYGHHSGRGTCEVACDSTLPKPMATTTSSRGAGYGVSSLSFTIETNTPCPPPPSPLVQLPVREWDPSMPRIDASDCANACLMKTECHSFLTFADSTCTLLRMTNFPWFYELPGIQEYRKRVMDVTTVLGLGPCTCGGKLMNRYFFRGISNEPECALLCTLSIGCVGIYTGHKQMSWPNKDSKHPSLYTGYGEGCFVVTSHKHDMQSSLKPAIYVQGDDPHCVEVTGSGGAVLENSGGVSIDARTLECRTPVKAAIMP